MNQRTTRIESNPFFSGSPQQIGSNRRNITPEAWDSLFQSAPMLPPLPITPPTPTTRKNNNTNLDLASTSPNSFIPHRRRSVDENVESIVSKAVDSLASESNDEENLCVSQFPSSTST